MMTHRKFGVTRINLMEFRYALFSTQLVLKFNPTNAFERKNMLTICLTAKTIVMIGKYKQAHFNC